MSGAVQAERRQEHDFWESDVHEQPRWRPLLLIGGAHTDAPSASRSETEALSPAGEDIRLQFELMADELELAGAGVSAPRRLASHPAYIGILALGQHAVPLLVGRLTRPGGRPIWLTLLGSLTGFQPGAGMETIPEAAAAWIRWSKRGGQTFDRPR